ncbi:MAG: hypothetical protein H6Q03_1751 [Acidobacteria bacterium]|nr:hypothetical protein [Acidobacteriota bacterium]
MASLRYSWRFLMAALLTGAPLSAPALARIEAGEGIGGPEAIEIAIVLDTSGSMEPLIDAARVGLWDIVNDLARLEPAPQLRVALIAFGGKGDGSRDGWVRLQAPLTRDLDLVSGRLFEMEAGGGTEYVGRALRMALERLAWSPPGSGALRLVLLAGNEPADQDPEVDFLAVGHGARQEGFDVFVIYCGRAEEPTAATWKQLATEADGAFASMSLESAASLLGTPYDREMIELGKRLNATYVSWGGAGREGRKAQTAQDRKVARLSPAAAAARAETKAGALYEPEWDLVGAVVSGRVDLGTVAPESLPHSLRGLTGDELAAWVQSTWLERQELQKRILALGEQRRQHLDEQARARGAGAGGATFESIVRDAIRRELEERGFRPAAD